MSLMLDDVYSYLVSQSLIGGATGWTGFKGHLPDDPDKVIAIFETPGGADPELEPNGSSADEYDEPGFQIRGRGDPRDYAVLRSKMGAIYRALHGSSLGSADFIFVVAKQSGPMPLGRDGKDRPELAWNFTAMRRRNADS